MITETMASLAKHVKKRIWIFSDLQLRKPEQIRNILETAIDDYRQLGLDCDQIWYLGDALIGADERELKQAAQVQTELLRSLNVPVRFVLGNHDIDYIRLQEGGQKHIASFFHEAVKRVPGWRTTDTIETPYFTEDVGDFKVFFLSDHADLAGDWYTNGRIIGSEEKYPYQESFMSRLKEEMANAGKPVIIASHYSFAGGNRPSELWNRLLPLPDQAKVVFYGHSHIGDRHWGKEHVFRKIACVEHQSIPQINVSSLENIRGDKIRSVYLEMYHDQTLGVYFRESERREWTEMLLLPMNLPVTR